jgi:hypothetical protein
MTRKNCVGKFRKSKLVALLKLKLLKLVKKKVQEEMEKETSFPPEIFQQSWSSDRAEKVSTTAKSRNPEDSLQPASHPEPPPPPSNP